MLGMAAAVFLFSLVYEHTPDGTGEAVGQWADAQARNIEVWFTPSPPACVYRIEPQSDGTYLAYRC